MNIYGPYSGPPPVPTYRPALPEGLGSNLSGGIGSSLNKPLTMNEVRKSAASGHAVTMITTTLVAEKNEATDHYEYVPLFVRGTDATKSHEVYSLWHLNSKLREETVNKQTPRKINSRRNMTEDEFPTDINEFCREIKFAGFQVAAIQQHPDGNSLKFKTNKRTFTVQLQGRLHNYPNVWGDDIRVGDEVAFAVKYVNTKASQRSWDDRSIVDRMGPVQCLQVVPVICRGAPVATTAKTQFSSEINKHDCSAPKLHTIRFGEEEMTIDLLVPSVIIPVGFIQKRMGHPSEYDVQRACNTAAGYENLKKQRSEVDIDLSVEGKRLKWGSVV